MNKFVKVVTFVPRKIWNYTKSLNNILEAPIAIEAKWTAFEEWCTKIFGTTSAGVLFGKGASDAAIAYACDDGVCFVVSCVGCGADVLQFLASFVPGPNITAIVTLPVSAACKTFVWACKNQTLPWKAGCEPKKAVIIPFSLFQFVFSSKYLSLPSHNFLKNEILDYKEVEQNENN